MKKCNWFLIIWNLFWVGVIAYSLGELWWAGIPIFLIGVFTGGHLVATSLDGEFKKNQEIAWDIINRRQMLNDALQERIKVLLEENERLRDGESWKGA